VSHALPQAPQWAFSVKRFVHQPAQLVKPDAHSHLPMLQIEPEGQTLPQPPQLMLSVSKKTH
jgi:hypothetical protein